MKNGSLAEQHKMHEREIKEAYRIKSTGKNIISGEGEERKETEGNIKEKKYRNRGKEDKLKNEEGA